MSPCYHVWMATQTTTVRLPELLKAESEAFAASLGISLNALMAVALRDYLDGRSATRLPAPGAGSHTPSIPSPVTESPAPTPLPPRAQKGGTAASGVDLVQLVADGRRFEPPKQSAAPSNPKHRCPCGSGRPWKRCHGKP